MWKWLYIMATKALRPAANYMLMRRIHFGKEDPDRVDERRGVASYERPEGRLIWMHGASVGETSMLLPLIDQLLERHNDINILVTSGTKTSAQIMADRLPRGAFHQMMPLDVPAYVTRFLDTWKPDLAVWAESEIWPNLVLQTKASDAKMALINARMSQKSIDGWRSKRGFAREIFGCFDTILPADDLTHNALKFLGGNVVSEIGNLKTAAPAPKFEAGEAARLRNVIGDRPIWLAASTHAPEEELIITAHEAIRAKYPKAILILLPRHPERGDEIAAICDGHNLAQRSKGEQPDMATSIYLMDTLGEMGLALALSDLVFIGGSLDRALTGHNPLEPARADVPILTGPHVASFTDIYARFDQDNALMRVTAKSLGKTVIALLGDAAARGQIAARAQVTAQESDAVLDSTITALEALL